MLKYDFKPSILDFFFDKKIRELCKSCKRYGKKAQCPPYIESVEYYQNLLPTYAHGTLILEVFDVSDPYEDIGRTSSEFIRKELISIRQSLFLENKHAIVFGAGSCKICEGDCSFPCRHPELSLIPIEATGIDVKSMIKYLLKKEIKFPIEQKFYRIGMILWD